MICISPTLSISTINIFQTYLFAGIALYHQYAAAYIHDDSLCLISTQLSLGL